MKILNHVSGKLIMVAIAFSFAASTPIQARVARSHSASARSEDDARLVVSRQPILVLSSTSTCSSTVSTLRIWGLVRVTMRCCAPGHMSCR
jgi:hypothetical protein